MNVIAHTKGKPCTIMIRFRVNTPKKLYIKVKDPSRANTVFTSRYCVVNKTEDFFIRMPITSEKCEIIVRSQDQMKGYTDNQYRITDLKKLPLKRKLTAFNHAHPIIQKFVRFAEEFCSKAGYISAKGSIYSSDDGKFRIDYLDDITDEAGKSIRTPARISRSEGIIQVSKKKFETYTIPMRMAILLHEFSHYYLNTDMANETEADLNGLLIYLGLGYPRIDAYNVFTQVFITSPNEANHNRMKIIDDFIRNFEKTHVEMNYDGDALYKNYI